MDKMKNTSTTLELPEGSKATIQGKEIDGKYYLVVEVENKSDMIDIEEKARIMLEKTRAEMNPEWTKFKRGDVLVDRECWGNKFVLFDEYVGGSNRSCFNCIYNNMDKTYSGLSKRFCKATDKEKAEFFKWLRDEEGLEWDGEKLVEVLKDGDFVIVWDKYPQTAKIELFKEYNKYMVLDKAGTYYRYKTKTDSFWIHAIKWDGTKEQYEKVLRGEVK